jgi:glycosyltransferase involved in cell wall biosynthesis
MHKIPLLYVIDHFKDPNAGTEGQLFQLIKYIDRNVFEPELLVFSSSPWLENNQFPCGVTILGQQSLASVRTWFVLFKFARSFAAKGGRIAHVFFNDPSIICPPVFFFCGIKTLISRRDMGYWYSNTTKFLLKKTRLFTCGAVANSRAVAKITCDAEGFSADKVTVIYNGYEQKPDNCSDVPVLERLKAIGLPIVALVANIRPIKRIEDALNAIALLKEQGTLISFVHIGDGNSSELMSMARELNIQDLALFMGKQANVKNLLRYADIGLLCSESEGFSNSIIEYLQQGLPVVCSDVGGNGEAVQNGVNGYLYPCGDISALAAALKKIVDDSNRRLEMGAVAKADALQKYSVENMVAEYASLYQKKLAN